jgi:hypothetical protein
LVLALLGAIWSGVAGLSGSAPQKLHPPARVSRAARRASDALGQEVRVTGFGALAAKDLDSAAHAAGAYPAREDYSYSNVDPAERARGPHDLLELSVLQEIIDLNGLTEASSASDFDDGNGVFEPLELGTQVWCGGHLRELYTGPSEYGSFGYQIRKLPASIGDLRQLARLSLNSNRIEELPSTISELKELRVLELYDNRLRELPESMAGMVGLEVLQVRGNQLREIPEGIAELPRLAALFIADNPLVRLPERFRLRGVEQAGLEPHVVRRGVDCSPRS